MSRRQSPAAPLSQAPGPAPLSVVRLGLTPRWVLWVLVLAYCALTLLLIVRVPVGRGPDEDQHALYVQHLASTGHLPVFVARGAPHPGYEFHQPPLYYALCAPLWSRAAAKVQPYIGRLVSLLCGAATLLLLWHSVLLLFPDDGRLPILATGFAALWPLHQGVGAVIGNGALAALFCTGLFTVIARAGAAGWHRRDAALLGLLAGLGLLTSSSCLAPSVAAAGAAAAFGAGASGGRANPLRGLAGVLTSLLTMGLVAALVCGWWLARNARLYGDPLAVGVFDRAFGHDPSALLASAAWAGLVPMGTYLQALLLIMFCTTWGIFGGPVTALHVLNPFGRTGPRPEWLAALPAMLACATAQLGALLGCVSWRAGWREQPAARRAVLTWWLVGLLLVVAAWVKFNTGYFQAQARYLHPAVAPLALFFALGWEQVWRRVGRGRLLWPLTALFAAVLVALTLWNAALWRTLV